jgi:hypothetical protein
MKVGWREITAESRIEDMAYILNLVKRVVCVSVETARIVKALPSLDELKQVERAG